MIPKATAATRWQQRAKTVMARGVETVMAKGGGDNDDKADQDGSNDDDDDDEMVETSITT